MAEITVKAYEKEITIAVLDGSNAEDWLDVFRTVMFHLGFAIQTIQEYLPTSDEIEEQREDIGEQGEYEA
jgi:hydrogenase maturation factor